jgi:uncharacterized protein (DUF58 family)
MPVTEANYRSRRSPYRATASPRTVERIDATTLMHIKSLELRAKAVVEGFWSGLNRSPYHGFSVEFTEYRQYTPGDDPRYIDWRLFARSDRYYIKRFEDETNLRCHLLVDNSRSMSFGSLEYTKSDYAKTLAATLAYFLSTQRDAVGLVAFGDKVDEYIPPRYRPGHLHRLLTALEQASTGTSTDLTAPLQRVAEQVRKRGLLVLVSDLLAPIDALEKHLGYLRARGHEVAVFHVLDPAELTLDFDQPAMFEDVESGRTMYVDPQAAAAEYRRKLEEHIAGIRTSCDKLRISYNRFVTDTPLELALSEFLRIRMQGGGPRARSTSRSQRRPA